MTMPISCANPHPLSCEKLLIHTLDPSERKIVIKKAKAENWIGTFMKCYKDEYRSSSILFYYYIYNSGITLM